MFEGITGFFKRIMKTEQSLEESSKDTAKERLHLVLMQDRANVSADFLELMKQEIIEVIKKYIEVDEKSIDVRLTNQANDDGTNGSPALYANIPILNIKNENKINREKTNEENNYNEEVTEDAEEKKEEETRTNDDSETEEQAEVVVRFADDEEDEDEKK